MSYLLKSLAVWRILFVVAVFVWVTRIRIQVFFHRTFCFWLRHLCLPQSWSSLEEWRLVDHGLDRSLLLPLKAAIDRLVQGIRGKGSVLDEMAWSAKRLWWKCICDRNFSEIVVIHCVLEPVTNRCLPCKNIVHDTFLLCAIWGLCCLNLLYESQIDWLR